MKEKEFINIIKTTLNSNYIGDDCAYLPELGIVITQDSLVEDVHFKRDFATPFQLGYKSAMVNISDVCASGAEPKYLTSALSLPENTPENFVKGFYEGMKAAADNVEIVGGDITGSDKIFISISAIGTTQGRRISSRKFAKPGYKIVISGLHGSSAAGLKLLLQGKNTPKKFITAHLMPEAQRGFSKKIAQNINDDYAMMDTSDGLADAMLQISESSRVMLDIAFEKIPYDKDLQDFKNYKDLILYGGEDYGMIAAVPENIAKNFTVIGDVKHGSGIRIDGEILSSEEISKRVYNHFS